MQVRPFVGHAGVAEEPELDVVALPDFVQQVIQIPADAGERLVKRADVDADAQRPLAAQHGVADAPERVGGGVAQSVKNDADDRRHRRGGSYLVSPRASARGLGARVALRGCRFAPARGDMAMKKLLLIVLILAVLAGAAAIYLRETTPARSRGVTFPLNASDHEIEQFLRLAAQRIKDLKGDARIKYISIFKNFGANAGQEFEHPNSHLTATTFIPRRVLYEIRARLPTRAEVLGAVKAVEEFGDGRVAELAEELLVHRVQQRLRRLSLRRIGLIGDHEEQPAV